MYASTMDVAVSTLRANLREYLDHVRAGDEVVINDRGTPIARIVGIDHAALLDQLTADGVIGRPMNPERPSLVGRPRPRPKRAVSDRVIEQRD